MQKDSTGDLEIGTGVSRGMNLIHMLNEAAIGIEGKIK